jgi:CheY-like chemotaxis protein/HPt (histidine-containing phosphotransfer) domain-containing protein
MSRSLVTGAPTLSLAEIAQRMAEHQVGSIVVVGEGAVVRGILTERDIVLAVAQDPVSVEQPAERAMSTDLVTVELGADLTRVRELMRTHHIRHLLVTDDDVVVGVLSLRDLERVRGDETTTDLAARHDGHPISETQRHAQVSHALGAAAVLRGLRVLVIDDNKVNRILIAGQLVAVRAHVDSARSGEEGLRLLGEAARDGRSYDVAMVDMQMPTMDGLALAHAVKQDAHWAGLPLVLATSVTTPGIAQQARAAGFAAYLCKPVSPTELYACLSHVVTWCAAPADSKLREFLTHEDVEIRLPRLKVLVVDDGPVNQQVAAELLARLGLSARVAADGHGALQALRANTLDVVLLDLELPDMTGLDLLAKIRELDLTKVPVVIAVTGHADPAVRDRCLAAGMDAYLTKPLGLRDLRHTLGDLFAAAKATSHVGESDEPPAQDDEAPSGLATFDDARALELSGGKPDVLDQVLAAFSDWAPGVVDSLQAAAKTGDWTIVARQAHALKGESAGIGATRLHRLAFAIEEEARQAPGTVDASRMSEHLAELDSELVALQSILRQRCRADK